MIGTTDMKEKIQMQHRRFLAAAAAVVAVTAAQGSILDRERGIRVGDRMTLEPYVSFSYTYDSNVDSSKHSHDGSQWVVGTGLDARYKGEELNMDANVNYDYHAYNRYVSQLNSSSYGESFGFDWADSAPDEPGWRVMFREQFRQIAQDDDMSTHNGRGMGRDRKQFTFDSVVERRQTGRLHLAGTANYYFLDYDNDVHKYASMYGWKRIHLGGEAGYMVSRWTDFIVSAGYQKYWQDNDKSSNYTSFGRYRGKHISSSSKGWTLMAGLGTRATEKLSYRVLAGWSRFEYGSAKDLDGWIYQLSADWQIDAENTFHAMAAGSSYYQPSETEYGAAMKVYSMSLGLAKGVVRNKLRFMADLAYRRQTRDYTVYKADEYDEDIWTGRLSCTYTINRLVALFARVEYQTRMCSGSYIHNNAYDYDRWRGTVGFTLAY